MEIIKILANMWDECICFGIGSSIIGLIFLTITTILAEKHKIKSSMLMAIPTGLCLRISEISLFIGFLLGIVHFALKLL